MELFLRERTRFAKARFKGTGLGLVVSEKDGVVRIVKRNAVLGKFGIPANRYGAGTEFPVQ